MVHTLNIQTTAQTELIDITPEVQEVVRQSGLQDGLCHIFVPHTTAAVTINENADPSVKADILMILNKLISPQEPYRHLEGNSPAHIKASLVGSLETVFIEGGRLGLGTWQGIFFCEFDGPRRRKFKIKLVQG
ncbi:MAG: YjbQ family protein [Deltaproteobacteria bacterium]|nr:YjbQ family protein [Deltaproteobacteria bacterium]MBW1953252.1 YjbQ family protein [Deltaproteobacteria bacterium]MBW1987456.1 YjbQ family protein [Deltaproteobacteria bacterium]MBW2135582.1 YjbQ family protein [Deltaproteobacteria bacterium]